MVRLPYTYQTEQDEQRVIRYGLFKITPTISANVRFEPDYHRQVIEVILRNVDRFESVALEFSPDALDEGALEDLVVYDATDLDWTVGSGPDVAGPIRAILLLLTGRITTAAPLLTGPGIAQLLSGSAPSQQPPSLSS